MLIIKIETCFTTANLYGMALHQMSQKCDNILSLTVQVIENTPTPTDLYFGILHMRASGWREGGREQGRPAATNNGKTGEATKAKNRQGGHTTSRQNKGRERGGRKGEKAHGTQPWQAEEQECKAKRARQLKQDSKGKEQTHSWGMGREGTGWVGSGGRAGRKEKDEKRGASQAVRTAHKPAWGSGRCTQLYSCIQGRAKEAGPSKSMRILLRPTDTSPMRVLRP